MPIAHNGQLKGQSKQILKQLNLCNFSLLQIFLNVFYGFALIKSCIGFGFLTFSYFFKPTFQFPIVKHALTVVCLPTVML